MIWRKRCASASLKTLAKCDGFINTYTDGSVKEDVHNEEGPVYQAFPLISL